MSILINYKISLSLLVLFSSRRKLINKSYNYNKFLLYLISTWILSLINWSYRPATKLSSSTIHSLCTYPMLLHFQVHNQLNQYLHHKFPLTGQRAKRENCASCVNYGNSVMASAERHACSCLRGPCSTDEAKSKLQE